MSISIWHEDISVEMDNGNATDVLANLVNIVRNTWTLEEEINTHFVLSSLSTNSSPPCSVDRNAVVRGTKRRIIVELRRHSHHQGVPLKLVRHTENENITIDKKNGILPLIKFKYLLQLYFVIWFIKFSPSRDEITLKKIKIKILMLLVVVDISTCFIAMINENASQANLSSRKQLHLPF